MGKNYLEKKHKVAKRKFHFGSFHRRVKHRRHKKTSS